MKIVHKLYIFNVLVVVVVLFLFGYFSYNRDVVQFETDMKQDASNLGHVLAVAVSDVWVSEGQDYALDLIHDENADQTMFTTRWVWLDDTREDRHRPVLPIDRLTPLMRGEDVVARGVQKDGRPALFTYIRVRTPDNRPGALELVRPLTPLSNYIKSDAQILAGMTLALIVLGGFGISIAGHWMIGKRLKQLETYAQQIGAGDLSAQPSIQGNDEITALGRVMHEMAGRLREAHEHVIHETEARIKTLEQLRHSERLATVGRLSAGMAHELGTPLNVISGRAGLITADDMDREELVECAEIIRGQADRMTQIIRQLLDYARRRPPMKTDVNLEELVRQVVNIMQPIAVKQDVTISFEATGDEHLVIADISHMQQVLTNIIMNGIHAMPDGGALHIKLERKPADNAGKHKAYEMITIADEGEGILPADRDHIFEPFYTTKQAGEGTGLGLSIAYDIMMEHDGSIDVRSEPDKGSAFMISLPGA